MSSASGGTTRSAICRAGQRPNHPLQQTAGACRLFLAPSSPRPRGCLAGSFGGRRSREMTGCGFIAVGVVVLASATTTRADDNALPAKARAVLEKAEALEVYSLDPNTERDVTVERPKNGF